MSKEWDTATEIIRNQWCQHQMRVREQGQAPHYCSLGAIAVATDTVMSAAAVRTTPKSAAMVNQLALVIKEQYPSMVNQLALVIKEQYPSLANVGYGISADLVVHFNDTRSHQEVIALFEKARAIDQEHNG